MVTWYLYVMENKITDQTPEQPKPEKCNTCYYTEECMLTPLMTKKCLGPFENIKHRVKVFEQEIKDKEKFKG